MAQISAQQTQTALAAPSATQLPTNTPLSLATQGSDSYLLATARRHFQQYLLIALQTPLPWRASPPWITCRPRHRPLPLEDGCNNSVFVADVTIPDGTIFQDSNEKGSRPGNDFQKIWRVQNTGTCKWDEGYSLGLIGGNDELRSSFSEARRIKQFC